MFWFKSISAGKMKDETDGLSFKDFFVIKPKTYSFLVDDFSQQKKAQGMNKNVAAKTSPDKQKNFLQKKKMFEIFNEQKSKPKLQNKNLWNQ